MADKIAKMLAKLPAKHLALIQAVLTRLLAGDTKRLDIKSLKGKKLLYRVGVGEYRIIFTKDAGDNVMIQSISGRDERTYKSL